MQEKDKNQHKDAQRCRLGLDVQALEPGRFEILTITAGEGNGWQFAAEVLEQSLPLWDGVTCFIDHAWGQHGRSVRDIAGVVRKPTWDASAQGIRAELHALGPAAELLKEIGSQILAGSGDGGSVRVGFSADIAFKGRDKKVEKIVHIYSVDLVFNPARGGAFLRALNQTQLPDQTQGDEIMQDMNEPGIVQEGESKQADGAVTLEAQLQEMHAMRAQMSAWLLENGLKAAHLPKPISERIKAEFADRVFEPSELSLAIKEARQMLAELNASSLVVGPGRVEGVFDARDRLQAAVDDLFQVPREHQLQAVNAPRLSGIRELYLSLTGDHELHGGYHPERVQLATTADFTGLVKNALNKLVTNTWEELGRAGYDWWQDVSVAEHFNSLHDITGTLIGTVGDLPVVAEGGAYTELVVGDSPETASFTKYGGYIPLTLELIDRDETRKLRAYARELASAGMRKISNLVAAIFTSSAGVGPTMADGGALFNATAVTTAGGHANLSTTALSANQWDAVCLLVYKQPMLIKNAAGVYGTGPAMAINPKFILVPRNLQKTAMEICSGALVREQDYVYDNVLKGSAVPVVVPEWTDTNNWAAVCDPRVAPAIYVGERFGLAPEIFVAGDELSPAVFMNDEHRLKVRHYLAVWVNDFRPLHKANVA